MQACAPLQAHRPHGFPAVSCFFAKSDQASSPSDLRPMNGKPTEATLMQSQEMRPKAAENFTVRETDIGIMAPRKVPVERIQWNRIGDHQRQSARLQKREDAHSMVGMGRRGMSSGL